MGYNRIATHNCPGLIILIVDGSSTPLQKGNIIDRSDTDSLANSFISEWMRQLTYGEGCIFDDVYICCIIHENGKAYIHREGLLSSYYNSPDIVEKNVQDKYGTTWQKHIYTCNTQW